MIKQKSNKFKLIQRPAMIFNDVDGLEIEHVKTYTADGVKPIKYSNVKNLVLLNSPALNKQ